MTYTPIFDPDATPRLEGLLDHLSPYGVTRPAEIYLHHDRKALLAVNVALATGRPLLLSGLPGTGKTTLARNVAQGLEWEYVEEVVTSRTQARDLQWRFDALRRLRDAQIPESRVEDLAAYIEPGLLWWAFDPGSAAERSTFARARDSADLSVIQGVVVLLDEIDKAEPDIPNDLLVPLGANRIVVEETGRTIERQYPLFVCITTNGERDLPQAFLRRCVAHRIAAPGPAELSEIGRRHVPAVEEKVLSRVIDILGSLSREAEAKGLRSPSTAELLDALHACHALKVTAKELDEVASAAMWKSPDTPISV